MVLLGHALIAHLMLGVRVTKATGTDVRPIELLSYRASLEIVALILLRENPWPVIGIDRNLSLGGDLHTRLLGKLRNNPDLRGRAILASFFLLCQFLKHVWVKLA